MYRHGFFFSSIILIIIISMTLTSCCTCLIMDNQSNSHSYENTYTLYCNLDLSCCEIMYSELDNSYQSYKTDGIPLAPLSDKDLDEYICCLESIYDYADSRCIYKDSDENTLVLNYDDNVVRGEFLHTVIHINTGKIASAQEKPFSTSFIPDFNSSEDELYFDEFEKYKENCYELLNGNARLSDIIVYNNDFLNRLYVPYMDSSIDLFTQKVRVFDVGDDKKVIACYSQAKLRDLPIDNENGYYSEIETDVPSPWRCVTFYVDSQTIDVIDIYRGIGDLALVDNIALNIDIDQALQLVSDHLSKEKLYPVRKIEFIYAYYPIESYVGLYLENIPIRWHYSFLLYPMWKICIFDNDRDCEIAYYINPSNGEIQEYRIINPGY